MSKPRLKRLPGVDSLLATLLFSLSFSLSAASIKIGIIDTSFCTQKLKSIDKKINIIKTYDATNGTETDCSKLSIKNRELHGHLVLKEFLTGLNKELELEIYPVKIFDTTHKQQLLYWKRGLDYLKKAEVSAILSATGLPLDKSKKGSYSLPVITQLSFLASGRTGPHLKKRTRLFPQLLNHQANIILVGSYHPPLQKDDIFYDKKLLYQNEIDYFFSGGSGQGLLQGSSKAVATALREALNLCSDSFSKSSKRLRACLQKNRKTIQIYKSKQTLPTF